MKALASRMAAQSKTYGENVNALLHETLAQQMMTVMMQG